ncbi:MAG TPA: SAM-dependent chlorinase/fluorinase [Pyrinomonadaceae bacterium]|nr:SAM-dependent chlorinase/fluorinase [Pyrinomonadaceae bacterium]
MKVEPSPVITLLTDFGTADYFVAAVKGVILTINPQVSIVDITHEAPPQDIESAAFTLLACYRDFPPGTIHVAVVDPGVGSARRPIAVSAGSYYFVGPDNGLFSYILDREPANQVFYLAAENHFRQSVSPSFHGRDIFAPVAAAISRGTELAELGPQITDAVRLSPLAPEKLQNGTLRGRIINIDHFGNCITNFTRADISDATKPRLFVNGRVVEALRRFFGDEDRTNADEHGSKDELFAIWGSAGFLELSVNNGSAAALLNAKRGDAVTVSE